MDEQVQQQTQEKPTMINETTQKIMYRELSDSELLDESKIESDYKDKEYRFDPKYISIIFGIDRQIVYSCLKEYEELFRPYMRKGARGLRLYSFSALKIFQIISRCLNNQISVEDMAPYLYPEPKKNLDNSEINSENLSQDLKKSEKISVSDTSIDLFREWKKEFQGFHDTIAELNTKLNQKDKDLFEKDKLLYAIKTQFAFFLPPGKEPESGEGEPVKVFQKGFLAIKDIFEEKDSQVQLLNQTVEKTNDLLFEREQSLQEKEKVLHEKEEQLRFFGEQKKREKELLAQLQKIDGKFFKKKERQKILIELHKLSE